VSYSLYSNFIMFILALLYNLVLFIQGGEDRTIEFLNKEGHSGSDAPLLGQASEQRCANHPFPMNYLLNPWPLGEWFYLIIKFGLVQYVCVSLSPTWHSM
jgi:hypothetical protein